MFLDDVKILHKERREIDFVQKNLAVFEEE
jgi:hypothetical protein